MGRHRDTDLHEELFLPGRHAEAQQPHRLLGSVGEGVRCVGRDVDGLTGAHDRLFAAESGFDLAFEEGEGLREIMPMGGGPPPRVMSMPIRQ